MRPPPPGKNRLVDCGISKVLKRVGRGGKASRLERKLGWSCGRLYTNRNFPIGTARLGGFLSRKGDGLIFCFRFLLGTV